MGGQNRIDLGQQRSAHVEVERTNREMIDPFVLTGTEFATTPRTFNTRRAISSELRRIERLERSRHSVVATPE